jgi:hypothetical protein
VLLAQEHTVQYGPRVRSPFPQTLSQVSARHNDGSIHRLPQKFFKIRLRAETHVLEKLLQKLSMISLDCFPNSSFLVVSCSCGTFSCPIPCAIDGAKHFEPNSVVGLKHLAHEKYRGTAFPNSFPLGRHPSRGTEAGVGGRAIPRPRRAPFSLSLFFQTHSVAQETVSGHRAGLRQRNAERNLSRERVHVHGSDGLLWKTGKHLDAKNYFSESVTMNRFQDKVGGLGSSQVKRTPSAVS